MSSESIKIGDVVVETGLTGYGYTVRGVLEGELDVQYAGRVEGRFLVLAPHCRPWGSVTRQAERYKRRTEACMPRCLMCREAFDAQSSKKR